MHRILQPVLLFLFFTALQASAQPLSAWDTLGLHTPLTSISSALQVGERLLVAQASGIQYSDDYGNSWEHATADPRQAYRIWSRDTRVYASRVQNGYDSTWVSENGGQQFEFWGAIRSDSPSEKVIRGDTMYAIIWGSGLYVERVFRKIRGSATDELDVLFTCPGFAYNQRLTEVGNRLVLLSTDGIRWSDDGGLSWPAQPVPIPLTDGCLECNQLLVHPGWLYFYNASGAFLRSADAGETWETLPPSPALPGVHRNLVSEGNDLLTTTSAFDAPIWRSGDLGLSWQQSYTQIIPNERILKSYPTPSGKRIFTSNGCFAVTAGDAVWETRNDGLPQGTFYQAVRTGPQRWVESDNYRLFLTEDYGHTYRLVQQATDGYSLATLSGYGTTVLAPAASGFLRSDDGGATWQADGAAPPGTVHLFCREDAEHLLVLFNSGELHRYQIANASWVYLSTPGVVATMVYTQGVLFVEGDQGIRASTDFGHNFGLLTNGLPGFFVCKQLFTAGNRVLAAAYGSGLYISDDLGLHWQYVPDQDGTPLPPFSVVEGVGNALAAMADFSGKVFLSDDGGQEWFTSTVPVQGFSWTDVTYLRRFEDSVYVGFVQDGRNYLIGRQLAGLNIERLQGRVFQDLNQNQIQEPGEPGLPNAVLYTRHAPYQALTDTSGNFSLPFTPPNDSLLLRLPITHYTATPPAYAVAGPRDSLHFAVFTDYHDLTMLVESSSAPRPGFEQIITLHVLNASLVPESGTVKVWLDPQLAVLETTPGALQVTDTLVWTLDTLTPGLTRRLQLRCRLDSTAVLGSLLKVIAWTQLTTHPDDFPENDADTLCPVIVGSFDPNDKTALQGASLLKTEVAAGKRLDYLIRFQNTGTFPAAFVRLRDTLSAAFAPESFRLEGASHAVTVRFAAPGVLDFFFPDIQLPDSSSDETRSHGFVRFSIAPQRTLETGDSLLNRAAIYFDFNPPVMTNVATTVVTDGSGVVGPGATAAFALKIDPNPAPADGKVLVTLPDWVPPQEWVLVSVYDLQGRCIRQMTQPAGNRQVGLEGLPKGVFVLRIQAAGRVGSGVLVSQ